MTYNYMTTVIKHYQMVQDILNDEGFKIKEECIKSHVNIITAYIINQIEKETSANVSTTYHERIFNQFMKDVRTFYAKERKVNFYADRLCFSSKYMATIIKEVSGRNPSDWIRDYVLLNAKAMLNSGEYSVQQVADLLNFPNPSFFGKYFRLYVGCTPKEYLNRKRI